MRGTGQNILHLMPDVKKKIIYLLQNVLQTTTMLALLHDGRHVRKSIG
jgi:hypothetical protein